MSGNYITRWEQHGEAYRAILDTVEDLLREAIQQCTAGNGRSNSTTSDATITREHSDVPEVTLRWRKSDGIGRSVQVVVADDTSEGSRVGHTGDLVISAWHDDWTEGRRHWLTESVLRSADIAEIQMALPEAIDAAERLTIGSLNNVSDLPLLPAGLSAAHRSR